MFPGTFYNDIFHNWGEFKGFWIRLTMTIMSFHDSIGYTYYTVQTQMGCLSPMPDNQKLHIRVIISLIPGWPIVSLKISPLLRKNPLFIRLPRKNYWVYFGRIYMLKTKNIGTFRFSVCLLLIEKQSCVLYHGTYDMTIALRYASIYI